MKAAQESADELRERDFAREILELRIECRVRRLEVLAAQTWLLAAAIDEFSQSALRSARFCATPGRNFMIRLSDDEFSIVLDAARPLARDLQAPFVSAVAQALAGRELGPGLVARTCREMQRNFWHPPPDGGPGCTPKYRR